FRNGCDDATPASTRIQLRKELEKISTLPGYTAKKRAGRVSGPLQCDRREATSLHSDYLRLEHGVPAVHQQQARLCALRIGHSCRRDRHRREAAWRDRSKRIAGDAEPRVTGRKQHVFDSV